MGGWEGGLQKLEDLVFVEVVVQPVSSEEEEVPFFCAEGEELAEFRPISVCINIEREGEWVGGWVGCVEEDEAVRMRCCGGLGGGWFGR